MKVFKFGGASVKNAEGVRNVGQIITQFDDQKLLVVVSAMGKNTNKLEELVKAFWENNTEKKREIISEVKHFHLILPMTLSRIKNTISFLISKIF